MIYWRQFVEEKQSACGFIQDCPNGEPALRTDQTLFSWHSKRAPAKRYDKSIRDPKLKVRNSHVSKSCVWH